MSSSDSDAHSTSSEESEDLVAHIVQKSHRRSKNPPAASHEAQSESPPEPSAAQDEVVTHNASDATTRPPAVHPVGVTIITDEDAQNSSQVVQQLLRRTRYFDEEYEVASIRCNNCGLKGHMAKDCRNERRRKPCFLCSQPGHESWSCPNRFCFKCGQTGHISRDCTSANTRDLQRVCLRCGREDCRSAGQGDAFRSEGGCSKDYLESDMQRVRCYVCQKLGHLCCKPAPQEAAQMSCYNCGGDDHWGEQCGLEGTVHVQQERRADTRIRAPPAGHWGGDRGYSNPAPWDSSDSYRDRDRGRSTRDSGGDRWDTMGGGGDGDALFTIGAYQASKGGSRHHRPRGRGR